jgi:outer membrane immunogenic protein
MTAENLDYAITHALAHTGTVPIGNGPNFIGGAQFGYNLRFLENAIFGLEADFQGLSGSDTENNSRYSYLSIPDENNDAIRSVHLAGGADLLYLGTARRRVGYLLQPTFLVYGTVRLAYGGTTINATTTTLNIATHSEARDEFHAGMNPFTGSDTSSRITVGWTVGARAEWLVLPG